MKIVVINGSPRKSGTVALLLKEITDSIPDQYEVEWVDVSDMNIKPCTGCVQCRTTGSCRLPEDDGNKVGQMIRECDGLIIGTPTYWGNMSGQLKILLDRNVPALMGETKGGLPLPLHKGKPAIIATACTTPWPLSFILPESRGAANAVKEVLRYAGFNCLGTVVKPGSKRDPVVSRRLVCKARRLGSRFADALSRHSGTFS